MAKLAMLGAVLALSLAMTAASELVKDERQCPGQMMLRSCEKFLSKGCTCGCEDCQCQGSKGIQMMTATTCGQQLKQCCSEMRRMDDECMCKGIKSIVHKIQQREHSFQGEDMHDMLKQAMKMPSVCAITTKPCPIPTLFF